MPNSGIVFKEQNDVIRPCVPLNKTKVEIFADPDPAAAVG